MRCDPEGLPDGEESDSDDHHVDSVGQLERAEGQPLLARHLVQAHESDGQADEERGEATDPRGAEDGGDGDEGQHHDGEVVGCADVDGERGDGGCEDDQQDRADHASGEVTDGGGGERLCAAPGLRHRVALDRGDDGRALPGVLRRIEVVEPPNIAP